MRWTKAMRRDEKEREKRWVALNWSTKTSREKEKPARDEGRRQILHHTRTNDKVMTILITGLL